MSKDVEYIVLFKNIRQVIKAEKYAASKKLNQRVMPVPRHISSECGMCLVADEHAVKELSAFLQKHQIPYRVEEKIHGK